MKHLLEPTPEEINNLTEISLALGVSKRKTQNQVAPLKLAFHPYSTTSAAYSQLEALSQVWQKLLFLASRNDQLIDRVYEQIKQSDEMISHLMHIRNLRKNKNDDDGLVFCRCDFFINEADHPKIIEYNLFSLSMTAHAENFQQAKRLTDFKNSQKYIKNQPNKRFTNEIHQIYQRRQLKGIFLILVSPTETNIIEQRLIEVQLLRLGIKVLRLTLYEVESRLRLDEQGNLKYNDETISVVYFRTGYQLSDYEQNPTISWKARQTIQISNAIKIPNISFELLNQKRMQVELSKESIYSQYLSPDEITLLKTSLVPVWEFDHITSEQFTQLINQIESRDEEYVLKPNLEGGGHNFYGAEAIQKLKLMGSEERKKYILMEKIATKPIENILINGSYHVKTKCTYEFSQYGIMANDGNSLLKSDTCGFLIRIKPQNANEGGIMSGVGSICSWIIEDVE